MYDVEINIVIVIVCFFQHVDFLFYGEKFKYSDWVRLSSTMLNFG